MVAFGLILVLVSGLLGAGILLSNTDPVVASAYGISLSDVSLGEFFVIGAATGLVLALGLWVAAAGAKRRRAKRRGLQDQVEAERSERELLEEQNELLREQLQRGGRRDEGVPSDALAQQDAATSIHAATPFAATAASPSVASSGDTSASGDVRADARSDAPGTTDASPAWTYPKDDSAADVAPTTLGGPADQQSPGSDPSPEDSAR